MVQHNLQTVLCYDLLAGPRVLGEQIARLRLVSGSVVCVARQLYCKKIQVAAGSIFSASGKYRNCLRINCALPLSETYREALVSIF